MTVQENDAATRHASMFEFCKEILTIPNIMLRFLDSNQSSNTRNSLIEINKKMYHTLFTNKEQVEKLVEAKQEVNQLLCFLGK